jgi:hypothetical protein
MSNQNVEKWILEDGRKAEKRIEEVFDHTSMTSEKVVELHMEDERPLKLKQRVIEKSKPVIFERKVETVDNNGNVVDVKIESAEPRVPMQLVEHIAVASGVSAQSNCKKTCHPKGLTKEDLAEAIAAAIERSKPNEKAHINSLGLADQIAEKVNSNEDGTINKVLIAIIVALTIGLGYLLFVM